VTVIEEELFDRSYAPSLTLQFVTLECFCFVQHNSNPFVLYVACLSPFGGVFELCEIDIDIGFTLLLILDRIIAAKECGCFRAG
jgi:hypothetical protein